MQVLIMILILGTPLAPHHRCGGIVTKERHRTFVANVTCGHILGSCPTYEGDLKFERDPFPCTMKKGDRFYVETTENGTLYHCGWPADGWPLP